MSNETLIDWLRSLTDTLQAAQERPYGREATPEERKLIGTACVSLCRGERDKAITLYKLIVQDCGGYMPWVVGWALHRATNTTNLVPDVTAPEPT